MKMSNTKGLNATRDFLLKLPLEGKQALIPTLEQVKEVGIDSMRDSINATTGEKSTGLLAEAISGHVAELTPTNYQIQVGPDMDAPHAVYAAREIPVSVINANVQVMPGKWRFIGTRPAIPKHPFLEDSMDAMTGALQRHFGERLSEVHQKNYADVKANEKTDDKT